MENKVRFYQRLGGRKAFMALLLFITTLVLFSVQGHTEFVIDFAQVSNFWKWNAGIFASGNVGAKCANTLTEWLKTKQKPNGKDDS